MVSCRRESRTVRMVGAYVAVCVCADRRCLGRELAAAEHDSPADQLQFEDGGVYLHCRDAHWMTGARHAGHPGEEPAQRAARPVST
jgi:hypothetical protein